MDLEPHSVIQVVVHRRDGIRLKTTVLGTAPGNIIGTLGEWYRTHPAHFLTILGVDIHSPVEFHNTDHFVFSWHITVYTGFLIRCQDGVDLIVIYYYTSDINQTEEIIMNSGYTRINYTGLGTAVGVLAIVFVVVMIAL